MGRLFNATFGQQILVPISQSAKLPKVISTLKVFITKRDLPETTYLDNIEFISLVIKIL